MIQKVLAMMALGFSMSAQAQEVTTDTLSAVQDSIFKSLMLQEVKVTVPAKTRINGDAMLTRIVGTSIANAGTAKDALAKVPGMMVRNGELEVIGKGTPVYYINGRKVRDLTELQRLSSHEINTVEVVTTPGAKYDAETSAVVLIRTARQRGDGFGIISDNREEKALSCGNNQWNSMLNLNYHHRSLDVFWGATYSNDYLGRYATHVTQNTFGREKADGNLYAFLQDGNTVLSLRNRGIHLNWGTDWQIAANHSMGMKIEYFTKLKGTSDFLMSNDIWKNNAPVDQLLSATHSDTGHSYSWLANAYYMGKVGKWGIDWNVDFYQTKETAGTYSSEKSEIENREVNSLTSTQNRLFASKLVLSHPLWQGTFNLGAEIVFVDRKSNYSINAAGINDSKSHVEESTNAAFVEYGKMIPHVGMLNLGARYEYVNFSYEDALHTSDNLSRHLDDIYPYVSWGTRIGEWQGSLSYAVKTRRPNYRSLRSNIEYNNRYTLTTGNPTLKNEVRHELGANAHWRFLSASLSYVYTKNGIYDWTYPYDDEGTLLVSWVNFDKPIHRLSAFVNLSPTMGIWQPNYTLGIQKQWLSFNLDDPRTTNGKREVNYGKPMLICNTNNAFRLPTKNENGKEHGNWS